MHFSFATDLYFQMSGFLRVENPNLQLAHTLLLQICFLEVAGSTSFLVLSKQFFKDVMTGSSFAPF